MDNLEKKEPNSEDDSILDNYNILPLAERIKKAIQAKKRKIEYPREEIADDDVKNNSY